MSAKDFSEQWMYEFYNKPTLEIDETGLMFDNSIKLAEADGHTRSALDKGRCTELLFSVYDCGRHDNAQMLNGVIPAISRAIAKWNTGERHLRQEARIAIAQIELPKPARTSAAYLNRMAKAQEKAGSSALSGLAKFNPTWATQPRQPEGAPDSVGGQFASPGTATTTQGTPGNWFLVGDISSEQLTTNQMKDDFYNNYWTDFVEGASELGIPPAYLAGLSAHETTYATSPLFSQSNNLFNLHANTNSGAGVVTSGSGTTGLTEFDDPAESIDLFIEKKGNIIRSIPADKLTPLYFAQKMQHPGSFGIEPDGSDDPNFVTGVCKTIKGLMAYDENSPACGRKKRK